MYNDKNFKTSNPPTFLLSLVAGTGVILIILALALGVIQADANSSVIGMAVAIGVTLMIIGIGGWVFLTRPFSHFDDINQPVEDDHGHAHAPAHDETHDEQGHPIVVADDASAIAHHGTPQH